MASGQLAEDIEDAVLVAAAAPEGIRVFLAGHGIRGVVGSCDECALARWVRRVTGADCLVGSTSIVGLRGRQFAEVHLPTSFQRFVKDFDRAAFPELLETSPVEHSDGEDF